MEPLPRKRLDHDTPNWVKPDSVFFITLCAQARGNNHFCTEAVGPKLLASIVYRHEKQIWFCHLAVLMPDHIHLLLNFPEESVMRRVVGDWKRWTYSAHEIPWQKNFFDHRLREEEGLKQKAEYILQNPVRAGLVSTVEEWPYIWRPEGG